MAFPCRYFVEGRVVDGFVVRVESLTRRLGVEPRDGARDALGPGRLGVKLRDELS